MPASLQITRHPSSLIVSSSRVMKLSLKGARGWLRRESLPKVSQPAKRYNHSLTINALHPTALCLICKTLVEASGYGKHLYQLPCLPPLVTLTHTNPQLHHPPKPYSSPILQNCTSTCDIILHALQLLNSSSTTTFNNMPTLATNFPSTDAAKQQTQPPVPTPSKTLNPNGQRSVKINACGELYKQLSEEEPLWYRSAPKGVGIDFEVFYYDTLSLLPEETRKTAPIVCLLHGAPGHYSDFCDLIQYLLIKGYRVIAPCYPSHEYVLDYGFRQSPVERVDYLRNFFQAIKIEQVDMMVGHSSSIYTIFELLLQNFTSSTQNSHKPLNIKSIGLLSSPSYQLPAHMEPTFWRMFILKMFDYPFLRPFMKVFVQSVSQMVGIKNRLDKIDNMVISGSTVGFSDHENLKPRLSLIREFQIPTYVMYGCQDKLISVDYFEQITSGLGVTKHQARTYDVNGELLELIEGLDDDFVQVSKYLGGGHYAFQKHSRQVSEDLHRLIVNKVIENK